jgi:hypothetical protein
VISVENTDADLRVTIPKGAMPLKRLNALLGWLRLEELAQRSRLTEADADRLADELKAGWWAANKDRFLPSHER